MSQLHGKQVKDASVSLGKLNGSGVVAFGEGASMSFGPSASLQVAFSPTANNDVVNKAYVDSVATGLEVKEAVRVIANTQSITLEGLQTIDGVSLVENDRVIVNHQGDGSPNAANGIYLVKSGPWVRAADFDETDEVTGGQFAFVKEGTTYADTGWVVSLPDGPITVGSGTIKFTQFSSAGVILAGDGLVQTGNTFDIVVDTSGLTVSANLLALNTTITGDRVFSNGVSFSSTVYVGGTSTFNSTVTANSDLNVLGNFDVNGTLDSGSASVVGTFDVTGASTLTGTLDVTQHSTFTTASFSSVDVSGTGTFTNLQVSATPSAATDAVNLNYFGLSFSQLQNQINNIDADFITAIEVGPGLSVSSGTSGTASISILDSTAGAGLSFTTGVYAVNLGDGLVFSGDNITIAASAAGNGLDYAAGVFTVNTSEITTALAGNGLTAAGGALDVNVNSDSLEIVADVIRLKDTVTGNRTFANDVFISGDLTVSGTTSYLNTTELLVEDNIITLNNGASAGVPVFAGFEVNLGSSTYADLLWDRSKGVWVAGLSGSTSELIQFAGTGLTKTGATLSINTAEFTTALAGNGLTGNGGALDVNVNNGLEINGDFVQLGGTLVKHTTINGANFNTTFDSVNVFDIKAPKQFTVTDAGTVSIAASASFVVTAPTDGIKYAASGYVTDNRSLTDKEYVDTRVATSAGAGLSFSGTQFNVLAADDSILVGTDDIRVQFAGSNDSSLSTVSGGVKLDRTVLAANLEGQGLTATNGVLAVELAASSGLSFSAAGAGGSLKIAYDTTTLEVTEAGLLRVKAGSAVPVYDYSSPLATSGTTAVTGVTLSQTPNDYSRIEVYVNGQRQRLYNNNTSGSGSPTTFDCWFGTVSNATALGELVSGAELVWNPSAAGFDLEANDRIEIVYEV